MITAKELFDKMLEENDVCTSTEMMVEFAKMHVQEALKQASEKAEVVDKCSILDAYSLDNVR